jgi:hypothetical protein
MSRKSNAWIQKLIGWCKRYTRESESARADIACHDKVVVLVERVLALHKQKAAGKEVAR